MASAEFDKAVIGDVRRTSAKVVFEFTDVTASEDVQISVTSNEENVSRIDEIKNAKDFNKKRIGTFEHNYFKLDGNCAFVPAKDEIVDYQIGWWSSDISDENGFFLTPPKMTMTFSVPHSSIGLTLEFDDDYVSELTFKYYNENGDLMSDETVNNESTTLIYNAKVKDFMKIEIYFNKTVVPYRRARLYSVIFGIIQQYKDNELIDFELTREVELVGNNQPTHSFSFKINNITREFNILNPSGIYEFLQNKQKISTEVGVYLENGKIEYINTGSYYLNGWESDGIEATLEASDKLYFATEKSYSSDLKTQSLKEWAIEILESVGILEYKFDEILENIQVSTEFAQRNVVELLKHIAQASNTIVFVNREDQVEFQVLPNNVTGEIDFNNSYKEPKIKLEEVVNKVNVQVYDYNVQDDERDIVSADNIETGAEVKEKDIKDNPFITTTEIAQSVANHILNILSNRLIYEIDWRQNPVRNVNELITIEDGFNENKNIYTTRQDFKFAGYLTGSTIGRGANG